MSPFDPPVSVVLALWAPLPSSRGIAVVEGADGAHEVDDSASPWGLGSTVSVSMTPMTRAAPSHQSQAIVFLLRE